MTTNLLKLQVLNPLTVAKSNRHRTIHGNCYTFSRPYNLREPYRRFVLVRSEHESATSFSSPSSSAAAAEAVRATSEPSVFTSSVGSSPLQLSHWNLTQRHIVLLNVIACVTAISATWLFIAAIPTLLAFKRAAESLAKLMDVAREELPDTMAAVRLSGMEISDLTVELSDLGQEITQGVRKSTRVVRVAEEGLRRLTDIVPSASLQKVARQKKKDKPEPAVASAARRAKEGLVKGRTIWQMIFNVIRYSRMVNGYFGKRAKQ